MLCLLVGACGDREASVSAPSATTESTAIQPSTATTSRPATTTTATPTATTDTSVAATDEGTARREVPVAATDPVGLARQLVEAATAIDDPATPPDALADAAFAQQVAYRQLGLHPEWDLLVLAEVAEDRWPAILLHAQARREFRSMTTRLQENLPPWRIVEPEPAETLLEHYQGAEAEFGIEWEYLAAINLVESGMGRIRGTSVAGAQGPMQFIGSTWEAFGEGDVNDPRDAIRGAARYLRHNGGAAGNIDGALFRYNNHNSYVRGVKAYAEIMKQDPRAYRGLHQWQVVFLTVRGDVVLFPGYEEREPLPVDEYLARS